MNKVYKSPPLMKKHLVIFCCLIFVAAIAMKRSPAVLAVTIQLNHETEKMQSFPPDSVKGDFNGDGKQEYMWLAGPEIDSSGMGCKGLCDSWIRFSDPAIPPIKIENCIGGIPVNLGDLNKNGGDEIGLLPDWFTSCWRNYFVWTLKNKAWVYAVPPIETHCNQWEGGVWPIEIDPKIKGNVIIRYSEMVDTAIVLKTKSVLIVK